GEQDCHLLLLRSGRPSLRDDVLHHLGGGKARERLLQGLEAPPRGRQTLLQGRDRPPRAAEPEYQRHHDGGQRRRGDQHASITTLMRQTALASAATPTASTISSAVSPWASSRMRRWMAAGWQRTVSRAKGTRPASRAPAWGE